MKWNVFGSNTMLRCFTTVHIVIEYFMKPLVVWLFGILALNKGLRIMYLCVTAGKQSCHKKNIGVIDEKRPPSRIVSSPSKPKKKKPKHPVNLRKLRNFDSPILEYILPLLNILQLLGPTRIELLVCASVCRALAV